MYEVGSKVVHPLHGVGTVEAMERKQVLGEEVPFLVIGFERLRMMVNPARPDPMLRPPIRSEEVPEVMEFLRQAPEEAPDPPGRRHQAYLEKLKSGEVYGLCEVVRSLSDIAQQRKLSLKDQSMLDQSRSALAAELGYVTRRDPEEMRRLIDEACGLVLQGSS